jgi:hypothetical protein
MNNNKLINKGTITSQRISGRQSVFTLSRNNEGILGTSVRAVIGILLWFPVSRRFALGQNIIAHY